jgi:hypothetical protein
MSNGTALGLRLGSLGNPTSKGHPTYKKNEKVTKKFWPIND